MNYKLVSIFTLLFIALLGVAGAVYFYSPVSSPVAVVSDTTVACTEEAKVCPDGSSVGRTEPNCEFAPCPGVPPVTEATTAALNQKIFTGGVFITPLTVLTDSRCPTDVTCIWAGEVTLKTKLEKGSVSKEVVLKMNVPATLEGTFVTLESVAPENNSKKPFAKEEYRFTFLVTPGGAATPAKMGIVSGTVTTSPTCPVQRIPQEPQCAPKPYATAIKIRAEGTTAVIKTIQSSISGAFTVSLPIGSYELEAVTENNATFPRCEKTLAEVKADKTTTANISCDTGIR